MPQFRGEPATPAHEKSGTMKRAFHAIALAVWSQAVMGQVFTATPLPFSVGLNTEREPMGGPPINNAGEVVGFGARGPGVVEGYLYSKGALTELGSSMIPVAINNSGQITGTREVSSSHVAFLYSNGKLSPLGTLGSYSEPHSSSPVSYSFAHAINARGQVIGRSSSADQGESPFLFGDGMTSLHIGASAIAHGINDAGSITGEFFAVPGTFHAFLYRGGTVTDLGTLGGSQSFGNAINNAHQVTGTADTANGGPRDAFLYAEGAMRDLGSLHGSGSAAYAINGRGQVVGLSRRGSADAPAQSTATLWSGTKIIDLNAALARPLPQNALLIQAIGINDGGSIVANARDGNNTTAYLLTPVAPLMLACPASAGEMGVSYSSTLGAVGGVPPYSFSNADPLPAGLSMDPRSGAVAGTPNLAGVFRPTLAVVDSLGAARGAATAHCTITIAPPARQLKIFPARYSFGTVARFKLLHTVVTVMNSGTRPASIEKPSITRGPGTHSGDFTATSLCRSSLAPGKSCRIDIVVFAHDVGTLSATLNVPNDAPGSPQEVPLDITVASKER